MKICVVLLTFFGLFCYVQAKFDPNNYDFWIYPNPDDTINEPPIKVKNADDLSFLQNFFPKMTVYFKPKFICMNLGDEGCINGPIFGSGGDSKYLNSGRNPGK